jgi:HYDIN/CFA65/VesB-like, Ig-like domain
MSKYKSKKQRKNTSFKDILPTPLLLVLAGMILAAGALFAVWKSGQPASANVPVEVKGSPSLKVDQDKIDLGNIPLGKTVSVSFQLSNVGDQTLRFSQTPYVEVVEGC